ncbi:competence/damage-inducible protein A [Anaerotalea alkaliphila]|uniref:Putative competence-damage inducible protein n=1 Tax=Anaerotalea alkaliphila TaxID=2662126 RepID=A0A7X5HTA1_9FIRM|nr:competence/damage-inducible protein A [Anaerotalea alkaliphila]NDL66278.1 competence/damage-inducible protein A [Anaerotalea alkaliphila]
MTDELLEKRGGEMIFVGTELLLGDILNTNAQYLSRRLADLGISCYYQTVVGDNEERLLQTIRTARERSGLVLLSGGLGPTVDDITKEVLAKALGRELHLHASSKERIEAFFRKREIVPTQNNWKQALLPEGAWALENENGTAPGVFLEDGGVLFFLLPGPPNELVPMFESGVVPVLRERARGVILSRTLKLVGIGESAAEHLVRPLMESQRNPTLAPYAKMGEVHFRMTASGATPEEAERLLDALEVELEPHVGAYVFTNRPEELEDVVVRMLGEKGWSVSFAESCTGGLLASTLVNTDGASEVFAGGVVAYGNKVKEELLGVPAETLLNHGAVSGETAEAMAEGVRRTLKTDVGVSITGIAGPGGGTPEKPVGLVHIGCSCGGRTWSVRHLFSGNRRKVRESAAKTALVTLYRTLREMS